MKNYSKEELKDLKMKDLIEIAKEICIEEIPKKSKKQLIEFILNSVSLSMLYKCFLEEKRSYEQTYGEDISHFGTQLKENLNGIDRQINELLKQKQVLILIQKYHYNMFEKF